MKTIPLLRKVALDVEQTFAKQKRVTIARGFKAIVDQKQSDFCIVTGWIQLKFGLEHQVSIKIFNRPADIICEQYTALLPSLTINQGITLGQAVESIVKAVYLACSAYHNSLDFSAYLVKSKAIEVRRKAAKKKLMKEQSEKRKRADARIEKARAKAQAARPFKPVVKDVPAVDSSVIPTLEH